MLKKLQCIKILSTHYSHVGGLELNTDVMFELSTGFLPFQRSYLGTRLSDRQLCNNLSYVTYI